KRTSARGFYFKNRWLIRAFDSLKMFIGFYSGLFTGFMRFFISLLFINITMFRVDKTGLPTWFYELMNLDLVNNTASNPLLRSAYNLGASHHWRASNMDMDFLLPPSVAGWKAYYQAPGYYRNWIGSATLKQRKGMVDSYTGSGIWSETEVDDDYAPRSFDYFAFVAALEAPADVNELVAECAQIFLPRELHPDQLEGLKQQLIPNLPDMEWTRQYEDYLASPFNPDVANPVLDKLKDFFQALFSMAEFQLM
ncbi:MAG: hypothetical protein AAF840_06805, partial [Bacteroidota bacterium]